jgi:hypothetical protein
MIATNAWIWPEPEATLAAGGVPLFWGDLPLERWS